MAKKTKREKWTIDMPMEYIMKQCCRVGVYTMGKEEFENVFNGVPRTELDRIEAFCASRGLEFSINKSKKTFTFTLIDVVGD